MEHISIHEFLVAAVGHHILQLNQLHSDFISGDITKAS